MDQRLRVWLALGLLSMWVPACCHFGSDDSTEWEDYDSCENKEEGDPCTLCHPTDPECVETAVLKVCDADGFCGSGAVEEADDDDETHSHH